MELLRLLIFAYLSVNGDMHVKNLAVLRDLRGEWRISPAYDLPSSAFYGDRSLALPIAGRIRQQVSWAMLRNLAANIEVPEDLAASIVREQIAAAEVWVDDLDQLPFAASRIAIFRRLVRARIRHIQL